MKLYLTVALGLMPSLSLPAFAEDVENFAPLAQNAPAPTCNEGDNNCIIMTQNESYNLAEYGAIDFIGIPEDSRCPLDAVCVWAGRVRVELKYEGRKSTEKFELGLGGTLEPQWTDPNSGLVLSLQQVWPEKILSEESPAPYRIKVRVENRNAPSTN